MIPMLSILAFIIDTLPVAAALLLCFLALRVSAKVPFSRVKFYFRLMSFVIGFIVLMQAAFAPGETYILWRFTLEGLLVGLVITLRIAALMLLLPILVLTTSPYMLILGLSRLGLDYRASFIISATLNMVPLFEEEARNIMDAQKLRGVKVFESGSFINKLKAYPSLAIPLMLGAMRRAQLAGIAMDARAFGAYKTRTWLLQIKMRGADYLSFAAFCIFAAGMLFLNAF